MVAVWVHHEPSNWPSDPSRAPRRVATGEAGDQARSPVVADSQRQRTQDSKPRREPLVRHGVENRVFIAAVEDDTRTLRPGAAEVDRQALKNLVATVARKWPAGAHTIRTDENHADGGDCCRDDEHGDQD